MKIDKSSFKPLAILVALGVGLNWALHNLSGFAKIATTIWGLVFPFILGVVFAFLLNIPMGFLERKLLARIPKKPRRVISFILSLIIVIAVVILVVFLVVPQLIASLISLTSALPGYFKDLQLYLLSFEEYIPQIETIVQELNIDWYSLAQQAVSILQSSAGSIFSSVFGIASSIVSGTVTFVVAIIFAAYILLDKEHLRAQADGILRAYLSDKAYAKVCSLGRVTSHTFRQFVTGQCAECVAIGLVFAIILPIAGFKYWILISVLIGFMSLIPIFGSTFACIAGAFLILVDQGVWRCIAFVILFLVIQQLDGNFMYPHIVGNSVGLPPIWVLVAVTLGGSLMGITGMILFIPVFSVVYSLFRQKTVARLKEKGDLPPDTPVEPPTDAPITKKAKKKRGLRGKKVVRTEDNTILPIVSDDEKRAQKNSDNIST